MWACNSAAKAGHPWDVCASGLASIQVVLVLLAWCLGWHLGYVGMQFSSKGCVRRLAATQLVACGLTA